MKKVNLTLQERFGIKNLLNLAYSKGGLDLSGVMAAQRVLEKIFVEYEFDKKAEDGFFKAIKGPEALKVNMRTDGNTFVWDVKKDKEVEIELSNNEHGLITEIINNKSAKKELGTGDMYLIGLAPKFGIEIKE
jgi:hypothetical protein